MWCIRLMLLVALVAMVGCGGGPAPIKANAPAQVDQIKSMLESMAESGEAGSGMMQLETLLSELRGKDPDTAAKLEPDVKALMAMSKPEEIKAKAKEILGKL